MFENWSEDKERALNEKLERLLAEQQELSTKLNNTREVLKWLSNGVKAMMTNDEINRLKITKPGDEPSWWEKFAEAEARM